MDYNGGETLSFLSKLNPLKDSSFSTVASHDPNKHGSERMRRVLEECSNYYWWHQSPLNQFIRNHHPGDDQVAVLEDESGREFKVDFFDKKWSLSNGWKQFCVVNKLLKKDYLVFHWVQPSKFEVYVAKQIDEAVVVNNPTFPSSGSCLKDKLSDMGTLCGNVEKRPREENSPVFGSAKLVDTMFGTPSEDSFYTQNTKCLSPSVYVVKQTDEAVVYKNPTLPNPGSCLKDKLSDKETLCVNAEKRPRKLKYNKLKRPSSVLLGARLARISSADLIREENSPVFGSKKQVDAMFGVPSEDLFYTQNTKCLSPLENQLTFEPFHGASNSKNFRIIVDGIDITSEIPERTRTSYLNLCGTHNSLLHCGLTVGINPQHALFIISTTTDIFNAMKNSNIFTPSKEFVYWSKSLESFSTMGMDVGFMRVRVERLLDLAIMATKAVDMEKYKEIKVEGKGLEEKIKYLELEIEKMREKKRKIDNEREGIKKKVEDFEAMFKLEATSPW